MENGVSENVDDDIEVTGCDVISLSLGTYIAPCLMQNVTNPYLTLNVGTL